MSGPLYRQLKQSYGPRIDEITRRELLLASAATGAALLLSGMARGASRLGGARGRDERKRVVVIGGGLAGLACAYELRAAGYDAIVLEARERVGGRVLSFNLDLGNEFIADRNVEGGAEFIGTNHPVWCAYATKFGLDKLIIKEAEGLTYPIVIDGKRLDDKAASELWDSMSKALNSMNALAATVDADEPWKSPKAAELDKRTVQSWIDALDADKLTKRACWINQCADNGVDPANASLLGELAAVKGGGLERFWKETEAWRCKGGNGLLAKRLAAEVGEDRVQMGVAAAKVEQNGDGIKVRTKDGRIFECDDVVLAVPPSVWAGIEFTPALPATLKPRLGLNVKYLAHTKTRFWVKDKVSSDALSDGPVQETWDATEGQDGENDGCLVAFSGGPSAARCLAFGKDTREAEYGKLLKTLYPKWDDEFKRSRFMDWASDPWTKGSYSFPAPGEVTAFGPVLAKGHMEKEGKPRLHFAGEHTCYKFVGYMEGALQSGVRVAKAIAARDGVTPSK